MGLLLSLFRLMHLLFLLSQLQLILTHSPPFMQPRCHDYESSALLQFKESFVINKSLSNYLPTSCQKVATWTVEGHKSDCCSWDGVECDKDTGHVIGLDLSSSCLYGSINSTSSLFHLVHLQRLNLADNHFNYSCIPSQVRDLSRLTHLNLNRSHFSGQIPLEISQLSHLSSLDLSHTDLELKKLSLRSLVGNLTRLQKLDLNWVKINSAVPNLLANLSFLTYLSLDNCGLHGKVPIGIFNLSNLQFLNMADNEGLTGYLPGITWSSPLKTLDLSCTSFSRELPASMGNFGFLSMLILWGCNFSGSIPSSFGNLTKLTFLDLSNNAFVGSVPPSLGNLTKLNLLLLTKNAFVSNIPPSLGNLVQLGLLDISYNKLTGPIPFELVNMTQLSLVDLSYNLLSGEMHFGLMNETQLTSLDLSNNQLTGPVAFGPMNLTQLINLDLSGNKLHGQISNSFFNLKNLQFLDLSDNYLNGVVEFDDFVKLFKSLTILDISGNQLLLLINETSANTTLHKFQALGFSSCNLSKFPNFLRNQHELEYLNLSKNKIQGQVPDWMWNTSTTSLEFLDLSKNFLTSFGQHSIFLPWIGLQVLDLKSNLLQGSLPIPPTYCAHFYISNNSLTGNIPELICNLSSLEVLDLANNNLSGSLPRCLDNFGASLYVLDLRMNKFQGSIPETWIKGSQLGIINFSQNKFQGHLPRSLANCVMLKVLDLSDNQLIGRFPFWFGHLPNLEVLILRSNKFNGPVWTPQTHFTFSNMRILDISCNNFTGKLPLRLLENWKAGKFDNVHPLTYIHENPTFEILKGERYADWPQAYTYSMRMTVKGNNMFYEKVQELFTAIDFSSNKFVGEIPKSIINLNGAQLLNFSNNALTGHIPSSLGKLIEMETLDLSHNKLSGEIPQQLTKLTFLEVFNVSHNNLVGPIPQGNQFDTFENNSFEGNLGLCGRPLTRKCGNSDEPPSHPLVFEESQDSGTLFEFGWKIVVIGYGFGFIVGVVIGQIVITRKHDWLTKTFRIRPLSGRRRNN